MDNSAAEMHTTIYSISESPQAAGTIWVGTDDGNVQLTRDDGKSWTNVTGNLKGAAEGVVGKLGRGEPARRGHGLRDVRPPHLRRPRPLGLRHARLRQELATAGHAGGRTWHPRLRARHQGRRAARRTCCSSARNSASGSRSTAAQSWASFKGDRFPGRRGARPRDPAARQRPRDRARTVEASGSSTTSPRCAR